MSTATADDITHDAVRKMFYEAEEKGLWFYSNYQGIWLSPQELAEANKKGNFQWGAVNWELRDPKEHLAELERKVGDAKRNLTQYLDKL